jgi:hypothetical protein
LHLTLSAFAFVIREEFCRCVLVTLGLDVSIKIYNYSDIANKNEWHHERVVGHDKVPEIRARSVHNSVVRVSSSGNITKYYIFHSVLGSYMD